MEYSPSSESAGLLDRVSAAAVDLFQYGETHTLAELLTKALDEMGALVDSPIGFYHFVEPDQKSLRLQQWSTRTLREFCHASGHGHHYSIDEAGVWVDCVRQMAPVVHNDYAALPHRKGLPPGHAAVVRELVVPVIRGSRVLAILGVGNKPTNYTAEDVRVVSFVAEVTWHIVERKRAASALEERDEQLRMLFRTMPVGWAEHRVLFDSQGAPEDYEFVEVNAAFERFTGVRRVDVLGRRASAFFPGAPERAQELTGLFAAVAASGQETDLEVYDRLRKRWFRVTAFSRRTGYFVTVLEDITERKTAEETQKALTEDLARSNAELEQFAYVASHDLQEPLRMVASFTQLLAQRYEGKLDAKADSYIRHAVDGAERMRKLISDLLALSRVGTRGKPLEPTSCREVVAEVLVSLAKAIEESGAELTIEALPDVLADRTQLRQVFQNLLSNAIKFRGSAPPKIVLSSARRGPFWELSVQDDGIGIAPQFHERIFGAFQRLHERGRYEGTGIGLTIVKKVLERHGGQIRVESDVGRGARFVLTLPAVTSAAVPGTGHLENS